MSTFTLKKVTFTSGGHSQPSLLLSRSRPSFKCALLLPASDLRSVPTSPRLCIKTGELKNKRKTRWSDYFLSAVHLVSARLDLEQQAFSLEQRDNKETGLLQWANVKLTRQCGSVAPLLLKYLGPFLALSLSLRCSLQERLGSAPSLCSSFAAATTFAKGCKSLQLNFDQAMSAASVQLPPPPHIHQDDKGLLKDC